MTYLLASAFLREYRRRPLNIVLLLAVPVAIVLLSAGVIAEFAAILGSDAELGAVEAATAGWAAALLAGTAGYFQVTGSRAADRRLAAAGLGTRSVVTARLFAGAALASIGVGGALLALWLRVGIDQPLRTVAATVMFALIYLAIGAGAGALIGDELNGSLVVLFVWMFDMFLGPGFSGGDAPIARLFPTHFPTLVILGVDSGHSSTATDWVISVVWTFVAIMVATWVLVGSTRPLSPTRRHREPGRFARALTRVAGAGPAVALRYAIRQYRRNLVMWVLLGVLPVAFITLSFIVTPEQPAAVMLTEGGVSALTVLSMVQVHGAVMAPITIAFLSGVAGLFVVLGSAQADRRLVLAGFRTSHVLVARVGVIVLAAALVTGVSLGITAFDFSAANWVLFAGAAFMIAWTYAMIGVIIGLVAGRIGGLYLTIAIPFVDVGIAQNVMFDVAPPGWARIMPSYGAMQLLIDGAFTPSFDLPGAFALSILWLLAVGAIAVGIFHRLSRPQLVETM